VAAGAVALALGAAMLHAVWNLLLARAPDTEAATAVALATSAVICAPVALLEWRVDAEAWPYIAASSALELAYFALLGIAYRRAELSVVYPLARGLAPVVVLVGAVVLTGADTSSAQIAGVGLVAAGVALVRGLRSGTGGGVAFGLAIACCIAAYTVVDKHGVEHASPLAYLELITLTIGIAYASALAALRGPAALRAELNVRAVAIGIASFAAYGLVLAALRLAPAASVAAVRETSVLIATALAAVVLREHVTRWRFAGAVLVVGGVALLAA
jgi:drug/metabolite transporter (DMT)-like permease